MFLINTPATSAETHQVSERNEIVSLKKSSLSSTQPLLTLKIVLEIFRKWKWKNNLMVSTVISLSMPLILFEIMKLCLKLQLLFLYEVKVDVKEVEIFTTNAVLFLRISSFFLISSDSTSHPVLISQVRGRVCATGMTASG